MDLFERILQARGLQSSEQRRLFLHPEYGLSKYNPFLLPDMEQAVERLVLAHGKQEKIVIYGDYDVDGLTATAVLVNAFQRFGFGNVEVFIPNRFIEGYGLTVGAVEEIARLGAKLIVTVDCGSLSEKEIIRAGELGMEVVVTDHHNVAKVQPPAAAVVNPKRLLQDFPDEYEGYVLKASSKKTEQLYPFLDIAGVGVAFKLVQALQTRLEGLPLGQEKWLLDLVALGTVSDIVNLVEENRVFVFWGLKVLAKTHRSGIRALMAVSGVEVGEINSRSIGFALGPRLNAAGRLETARLALDLLLATDQETALAKASQLDDLNIARRREQDRILAEAVQVAEQYSDDPVLVVSGSGWSHGIIGIVAAKLLEKYQKPTFVLEEMGEEAKGSARSYGDFSAAEAIRSADDLIIKGGGHKLAAGVTLLTENVEAFRQRVNQFYWSQNLTNQQLLLLPKADVEAGFEEITEELVSEIAQLEPFGNGNLQPVLQSKNVVVIATRRMGSDGQHIKLTVKSSQGVVLQMLAFNAPEHFFVGVGSKIDVWYQPDINEWNGRRTAEGRLLHLEKL